MFNEGNFFIGKEKIATDEAEQKRIKESKDTIASIVGQKAAEIRAKAIEFRPEMEQYISGAENWHEERFQKLGVPKVTWGEHIYKVPRIESGADGESGLGITQIADLSEEKLIPQKIEEAEKSEQFLPIEVPENILEGTSREEAGRQLQNYVEALIIAHELYHDAAPTSVFVMTETDTTTGEKQHVTDSRPYDRSGVHYIRRIKNGDHPAVEEGLAMTAQKESEAIAAKHFPAGARIYERLLDYVADKDSRIEKGSRLLMSIRNFDGKTVKYGPMQYLNGYILTGYLSREIPGFFGLVEQARVEGKVLPLAREVEKKFGRGSYKRVFTAGESEALSVLRELQSKVSR